MGFEFASKSKQPAQHKSSPSRSRTGISLAPPHSILQLQRTLGNQGVLRLLESQKIQQPGPLADTHPAQGQRADIRQILYGQRLQPKLTIGEPNDKYEQEADRVADQVMRVPDSQVQRQKEGEGSGSTQLATGNMPATSSSGGSGQPLPDSARSYFEPRFGPKTSTGPTNTVQRDILGAIGEAITQPFENIHPGSLVGLPLSIAFDMVTTTSILSASGISIPSNWPSIVREYAFSNLIDGVFLLSGLLRLPSFWRGGWIMGLQPNAGAMTLDDDIFVSGRLSLSTYAHELVHVAQYNLLGKVGFLTSYFGLSAVTIAGRFITGQPLEVMRSSPHEEQAYQIHQRFDAWYSSNKGGSASSVTA